MNDTAGEIVEFDNQSSGSRKLLKQFVDLHWQLYAADRNYIPLLHQEYLGSRLLGMTGYFEPRHTFFRYGQRAFFLARADGKTTGRCVAFINPRHNERWQDRTGFLGFFECIDSKPLAADLLARAGEWLRQRGMTTMRGPQNLPVNEATPGILTSGFDSRPVIYYQYSKPYYADLLTAGGMQPVKQVRSWEVAVMRPLEEKLIRVSELVRNRRNVSLEGWGQRPLAERKREMLDVYNDAWYDNYGFVPFTEEEFSGIVDDMLLVMDKKNFVFAYSDGTLAE